MQRLRVAIVGASGYTGAELLRLLLLHPRVEITSVSAGRAAGQPLAAIFPQFQDLLPVVVEDFEAERVAAEADLAFTALPHAQSARIVDALRERAMPVIDLSADFRLDQASVYEEWYGSESEPIHPAPSRLSEATYGLPELHREAIAKSSLVAAPGCYPTSALLAAAPLLKAGLIQSTGLIVDAKSGVSGAGRNPGRASHFPEAGEGVRAYKVAGTHRHTPEMEQELGKICGGPVRLSFTPHLVPMSRGILSVVYGRPTAERDEQVYRQAMRDFYQDEPFVSVLAPGTLPDTAFVRGSNRVHLGLRYDARAQIVVSIAAIDNLCKGSSGQAIQCLNLMKGWDEDLGLQAAAMFP